MQREFSKRTSWDRTETAIEGARRESGRDAIDLTVTNPSRVSLRELHRLERALSYEGATRYEPEALGPRSAREAIVNHLVDEGFPAEIEALFLSASTSEAYAWLFKLLADPGDEILVPTPSYPLFAYLAGLESLVTKTYPLIYEERFRVDLDALDRAVGERTRAIVVVSPNNPTGSFLHDDDARAIDRIAAKHGLAILSDEVFRTFALEAAPTTLGRANAEALTFVLDGFSKRCALPGMKLAFTSAFGPRDRVREAMARVEVIADTYLSVSTPTAMNARVCLAHASAIRDEITARLRANLGALDRALALRGDAHGVRRLVVGGGWSVILEVPRVCDDAVWVERSISKHGVLVQPGYFFDTDRDGMLVLSLLPETDAFARGVDRLIDCVEDLA